MTDNLREMLELAAKACGLPLTENGVRDLGKYEYLFAGDLEWGLYANNANGTQRRWNPYLDDGDSARLRSALMMSAAMSRNLVMVWTEGTEAIVENFADHSNDRNAALRMATLRCAAEAGRRMG